MNVKIESFFLSSHCIFSATNQSFDFCMGFVYFFLELNWFMQMGGGFEFAAASKIFMWSLCKYMLI